MGAKGGLAKRGFDARFLAKLIEARSRAHEIRAHVVLPNLFRSTRFAIVVLWEKHPSEPAVVADSARGWTGRASSAPPAQPRRRR